MSLLQGAFLGRLVLPEFQHCFLVRYEIAPSRTMVGRLPRLFHSGQTFRRQAALRHQPRFRRLRYPRQHRLHPCRFGHEGYWLFRRPCRPGVWIEMFS